MEIEQAVESFIRSDLLAPEGRAGEPLDQDTSLFRNRIVDSFGLLALVGFLESRFQITIGDEDMAPDNLGSIGAIAAFVRSRRNGAERTA
jgi:acyl carrier protein